ncbi:MAG: SLBB domain-containing protein [Deltaproteobacteria bacterium]|nr:SLBB domain-containing protein [Deltaproteobacteria bacterium]
MVLTFNIFLLFISLLVGGFAFALEGGYEAFTIEDGVPVYVIGKGDILEVTLWEGIEAKIAAVEVKPDGSITVSFVMVKADGLTVRQLTERLQNELKKFIREPRVDVRVKEYRSKKVTLLGAIQPQIRQPTGPGLYPLTGRVPLSQMITIAGGFASNANLASIQLTKKDGRTEVVNLFDLFFKGDLSKDIVLEDGDTVFVPIGVAVEDNIFIFGEVNRPGVYPLKAGTTLVQALGLAGGYKDNAVLKDIRVIRGELSNPALISIDVNAVIQKGEMGKDVVLRKNDIVYVPRDRISNWNAFLAKIRPTLEFIILPFVGARAIDQVIKGD